MKVLNDPQAQDRLRTLQYVSLAKRNSIFVVKRLFKVFLGIWKLLNPFLYLYIYIYTYIVFVFLTSLNFQHHCQKLIVPWCSLICRWSLPSRPGRDPGRRGPRLCAERRDGQMDRWGDLAVLGFDPGRDPGLAPGPSVLGSDSGRRSGEMGCLHMYLYIYIYNFVHVM
jgi:hypothetical protein